MPDLWKILNNSRGINFYIDQFHEPLTGRRIGNLLTAFHKKNIIRDSDGETNVRFRAAALLYRYGNKAGRKWFVGDAKRGAKAAALILAHNREPGTFNSVLRVYKNRILRDPDLKSIVAIARWNGPAVSPLLSKRPNRSAYAGIYAIGLAVAGAREQIPILKKKLRAGRGALQRKKTKLIEGNEWQTVGIAAALDRFGAADEDTLQFLEQAIHQLQGSSESTYDGDARTALWEMGYSHDKKLLPELTDLLRSLTKKGPRQIPAYLINDALIAIVRIGGKPPAKLLPDLLAKVWGPGDIRRFKAILIASGDEDAIQFLQHPTGLWDKWSIDHIRMSKREIHRIQKLRAMKWLPDDLLPKSSRGWDVLWSPM